MASRRHCELRAEGGHWWLKDLDSRHGTFVNGVPTRERRLEHTDVLQVGDSTFLFLCDDVPRPAAGVGASLPDAASWSTVQRRPEDVLYLQPRRLQAALAGPMGPDTSRIASDLQALLEVSTAVHELQQVEHLAARVLELLLAVLPAERGGVLLCEPGSRETVAAASHDRRGGGTSFPISTTLVGRVLEGQVGCLSTDVAVDGGLREAESLREAAVRSVLCAPLPGRQGPLGLLYFDTSSGHAFSEHHLELLTAAAVISAHGLANAQRLARLERENQRLQGAGLEHGVVGESAAMQRLLRFISRAAPAGSTVLLRGESGTGKEVAARALHKASPRAAAPFVAINCATLSETLLESELFGHEKGAFTGAVARKEGKLELAHGGTLFLDEVGELSPALQARLLRVLQEREFERVGGTRPLQVDVRLIAATNRDLEAALREGRFREDFFYRLDVISFTLPPLRERREDIPLLARHFARLHGERLRHRAVSLSPAALRALESYDWPGNIRQLGNVIERAVVLGADELIQPEDLPDEVLEGSGSAPSDFQATVTSTKKKSILDAMEKARGDYREAAALLGIHVNSLHRLIRNLGLKPHLPRSAPSHRD
ncbi:Response regulator of zinc sigma-54-dependent two-component system [Archangium gephyra]|uniref:Response regulator of zinc sigma-54-dependent two-component system n=1 Tax=Archangium gephyra TaxID=48 RepID=A0AAC8QC77_9BACT|nr:Response regulator of zinc sigma-54-dependent two-component system [Archangium gephyra]